MYLKFRYLFVVRRSRLLNAYQQFPIRTVGPRDNTDTVASAVGKRLVRWCVRVIDDASACSKCCL